MASVEKHKTVILESEQKRRDYLRSIVCARGHTPFLFEKASRCLDNILALNPDLVISSFLSVNEAFRFLNTLRLTSKGLSVVIISDNRAISDFIRINGFDNVSVVDESFNLDDMECALNMMLDRRKNCETGRSSPLFIGNSPEIVRIKKLIPELNRLNETVLIQGEFGTGKDLLAGIIHCESDRNLKPLVKINVPELLNSAKGVDSFKSGATDFQIIDSKQSGYFALANTGTLFLDEIGAMSANFQANLINLYETAAVSNPDSKMIDVRIIAATRNGLEMLVDKGRLRKDLYYRLNVIKIEIPPLRKRIEDIPQLADFFTDRFCQELGKSHYELSEKTKYIFCTYFWPGNVRELENLVRVIVCLGKEEELAEKLHLYSKNEHLLYNFNGIFSAGEIAKVKKYVLGSDNWSLKDIGQKFMVPLEKKLVRKVLERTNWNRRKAAVLLDISYKSLLNKIKAYDLSQI